jgi:hypothetical protein
MKYFRSMSLVLVLAVIAPPARAQPGEAVIQGYVWIDENLDGIRQLEEPLLPENPLTVFRNTRGFGIPRTDTEGWYQISLPVGRDFWSVHAGWGQVPDPFGDPGAPDFAYLGCAVIQRVTAGATYRLDIRLRPTYDERGGRGPSPILTAIAEPDRWPVEGGMFFTALTPQLRNPVCDAGFAVTNADGIPFWETLLAQGLDQIGRPVTNRLDGDGPVRQAFEYAVLEWDPDTHVVHVLGWDESGMIRGSLSEEPFAPGPPPHFLGLPALDLSSD